MITSISSASDIQRFLSSENFEADILLSFKKYNGRAILGISNEYIKKTCGDSEGERLIGILNYIKNTQIVGNLIF